MSFTDWGPTTEVTHEGFYTSLKQFLPIISSSNTKGVVRLSGFNTGLLHDDIRRRWGTTRLVNGMWHSFRWRYVEFYEFWALEMMYICQQLIDKRTNVRTPIGTLEAIKTAIAEVTYIGENKDVKPLPFNYDRLRELNVTLDPKQRGFLEATADVLPRNNLRGILLHGDAGTGKTITGLAHHLVTEADVTVFLVMGVSIDDIWRKEINNRFKKPPKTFYSNGNEKLSKDHELVVCHYEYFEKIMDSPVFKGKRVNIWVDESQHFNRMEADRTVDLVKFAKQDFIYTFVAASGTPFKAMGKEAIPLLYCCDPLFIDPVAKVFTKAYGTKGQNANDVIAHRIGTFKYRIEKKTVVDKDPIEYEFEVTFPGSEQYTLEAIKAEMREATQTIIEEIQEEIPDAIETFNMLMDELEEDMKGDSDALGKLRSYRAMADEMHRGFNQQTHKEYVVECNRLEKEFIIPALPQHRRKEFKEIKGIYKYPTLVARGRILGRVLVRRRIDCFTDIAKYANYETIINTSEKKTLMYSNYVETVYAAAETLRAKGLEPIIMTGQQKDVAGLIKLFWDDPKVNPTIATYSTLSTAVEMQVANLVILIDPPFRSYIREQTIARAWRKGQDAQVRVATTRLNTGGKPNLSTRGIDIMEWSQEMVDQLLPETAKIEEPETQEFLNALQDGSFARKIENFTDILKNLFK